MCACAVTARSTWNPTNQVRSDDSGSYASARLHSVFRENNNSSYIFHLGSTGEDLERRDQLSPDVSPRTFTSERSKKVRNIKAAAVSDLQGLLPCHRRLTARAAVRMTPSSIRKGSQVFRNPAQLDPGKQEELTSLPRKHGKQIS